MTPRPYPSAEAPADLHSPRAAVIGTLEAAGFLVLDLARGESAFRRTRALWWEMLRLDSRTCRIEGLEVRPGGPRGPAVALLSHGPIEHVLEALAGLDGGFTADLLPADTLRELVRGALEPAGVEPGPARAPLVAVAPAERLLLKMHAAASEGRPSPAPALARRRSAAPPPG